MGEIAMLRAQCAYSTVAAAGETGDDLDECRRKKKGMHLTSQLHCRSDSQIIDGVSLALLVTIWHALLV
jgi:hypothetical protein